MFALMHSLQGEGQESVGMPMTQSTSSDVILREEALARLQSRNLQRGESAYACVFVCVCV